MSEMTTVTPAAPPGSHSRSEPTAVTSCSIRCRVDATVASLSLGSGCVLEMANARAKVKVPLYLEPRSLVVLRDEARAIFPDTVLPRDFDTIDIPYPERGEPELVRWDDRGVEADELAEPVSDPAV